MHNLHGLPLVLVDLLPDLALYLLDALDLPLYLLLPSLSLSKSLILMSILLLLVLVYTLQLAL